MSKIKLFALSILICLLSFSFGEAGEMFEVECTNKKCNYKDQLNLGGAMMFEQIAGYCLEQKKFVYLTWGRQGPPAPADFKGSPPPKSIKVWNPATGETLHLYKCPECPELILPITDDLKHCPKCNKATLKSKSVGNYD